MKLFTEKNASGIGVMKKACLLLALVILMFAVANVVLNSREQDTTHAVSSSTVGEIVAGRMVRQTVRVNSNELYGFSLCLATYAHTNTSNLTVSFSDSDGNVLFEQTLNASVLQDNLFRRFDFEKPVTNAKGKQFCISVSSPDAVGGNAVTIWSSTEDSYPDGELTLDGIVMENSDLSFQLFHSTERSALPWVAILTPLLVFVLILTSGLWIAYKKPVSEQTQCRIRFAVCVLDGIVLSFALATLYTLLIQLRNGPQLVFHAHTLSPLIFSPANLFRGAVLLPFAVLITATLLWDIKAVLNTVFAKRWYVALGVFAWYLLCGINFSNAAAFHYYIQPDLNGDLFMPLFGKVRGIRSDEWLVNMPFSVSTDYAGYGKFNEILRGTMNDNLPATGLYFSYAALSDPLNFGYFLFGAEGGASFFWCGGMMLSIMLSLEFAYILSGKRKLFALLGVALIAFSPFNLWWSISTLLTGFMGILVCTYYCMQADSFPKRCMWMLGVAMSGAYFICQFYPAWQVPMVYILIPLFVWILVEHFEVLRNFRAREWIAAAVAIVLMASIVLSYLAGIQNYTEAIMGTVYPGARFETGGYALKKIFAFIQTLRLPFQDVIVGSNNSEASTFFALFPLPILMGLYVLIRQMIEKFKDRTAKLDLLNLLLLIPALFLSVFCTVGIPDWLARITLMSYSPADRAADWLSFVNLLLLIRLTAKGEKYKLPVPIAVGAVGFVVINSVLQSYAMCPGYLADRYVLLIVPVTLVFGMACFARLEGRSCDRILAVFAVIAIAIGLTVTPVNRGLESLTEKPAAKKIQEISQADPDAKWIGYGNIISGQYLVANGAPCITSTNYIPNIELWTKLDPVGQYNEIYNRYSHISLQFVEGETAFRLLSPDHIALDLSYGDIEKTECRYVFAMGAIEEASEAIDLRVLYQESNVWIYEIVYLH